MCISCRSLLFAIALAGAVAFEPWPAHAQSGAYLSGLVAAQAGAAHARIQQQQLDAAARFQRQNPQATILWYVEDTAYGGLVSAALFEVSDCLDTANGFNRRGRTLQYLCVYRVAP